ncbi:phage head-tail joining protein [Geminicoccus flavidas]|uniref:phage head-tail joining protein n=1 Tax=Geminicoccus flavidas TaxID=2506407 RepID=UPI00135AF767|nr:hypothetical protein [Geminicoccus flavidas]
MATVEELTDRLEKLRKIRASGVLVVESDVDRITYRNDAEIATAIADLERQISAAGARRPIFRTVIINDKGFH